MNDSVISKKGKANSLEHIVYTVPTGRICILVDWFVNNTTGSDILGCSVTIGGHDALPGNVMSIDTKYFESGRHIELLEGDTITVKGSNLTYFFSGIEQDAYPDAVGQSYPAITQQDLDYFRNQYNDLENIILGLRNNTQNQNQINSTFRSLNEDINVFKARTKSDLEDIVSDFNSDVDDIVERGVARVAEVNDEFYDNIISDVDERKDALTSYVNGNVNVLNARMDTFTNLPNGSTSGDAELADIRVGFDGISHSTAGTAVRVQANKLAEMDNVLSGYIELLASEGRFVKKNFIGTLINGNNNGSTITSLAKCGHIILSRETAIEHPLKIDNTVYNYDVVRLLNGSVVASSATIDNIPIRYLDETGYDTVIINVSRKDNADLTEAEKYVAIYWTQEYHNVVTFDDIDTTFSVENKIAGAKETGYELSNRASAIISESNNGYDHGPFEHGIRKIRFYGGIYDPGTNVRYADRKNLFGTRFDETNYRKYFYTYSDNFIIVDDYSGEEETPSSNYVFEYNGFDIPAGDYVFKCEKVYGYSSISSTSSVSILFTYEDDTTKLISFTNSDGEERTDINGNNYSADITFDKRVVGVSFGFAFGENDTCSRLVCWFGLFDDDVTFFDVGSPVFYNETLDVDVYGLNEISSIYNESVVYYVADTKEYIDGDSRFADLERKLKYELCSKVNDIYEGTQNLFDVEKNVGMINSYVEYDNNHCVKVGSKVENKELVFAAFNIIDASELNVGDILNVSFMIGDVIPDYSSCIIGLYEYDSLTTLGDPSYVLGGYTFTTPETECDFTIEITNEMFDGFSGGLVCLRLYVNNSNWRENLKKTDYITVRDIYISKQYSSSYIPGKTAVDIVSRKKTSELKDLVEFSTHIKQLDIDSANVGYWYLLGNKATLYTNLNYYRYGSFDCSSGDIFHIRGCVGGDSIRRLYAFVSSDNTILEVASSGAYYNEFHTIVAPNNATKLLVNELLRLSGSVIPVSLYKGEFLAIDQTPTNGSTNAVQSGGVKSALDALQAQIPQIDSTLSQSGQAADAKAVGDALASLDAELIALRTFSNTGTDKAVWATNAVNLSADSDYYFCLIGYTGVNTEGLQYIVDISNVYTSGSQLSTKIATAGELVKIRLDPSRTYTRTNIAFNRSADNPSSSTASSWTYAIFKGIPNRSRIADTLRNVALHGISAYTWENIAYYPSGAGWATTPDRISVRDIYPAQNLDVRAKDGYVFTANYFDGNGNYLGRALKVTHHTIPADSHVGLTVHYADDSAIAPEDAQNAVILTYVAGEFGEHKYSGDKIDLKRHSISMEQIAFTVPNRVESYEVMQAGDMFGGTYAQAYGNYLQLYDFTAGTLSAEYPMNGGHANSMAFSSDYYSQSDEYPLLYVGAFNSPTVYVNRITTNGVSLVDTLVFSASQTGYCTNVAIDPINKHLYMLGYSVNDPSQVSGNNIIVSKWDLGTVTDNGDNTHSPAFVKSFTLPVITYMQDCKYHGGKIFVLSGIGSDYPTKVYVIDVTGERIANIIDSFTTAISNSEKESIVINENDDYMLIGGFNGFYKIHF